VQSKPTSSTARQVATSQVFSDDEELDVREAKEMEIEEIPEAHHNSVNRRAKGYKEKEREYQSDDDEEEEPELLKPKKKTGILSRPKKTANTTTTSKERGAKKAEKSGNRQRQIDSDIIQTPMLQSKKRKGKSDFVMPADESDQEMNSIATPFLPVKATAAKSKAKTKKLEATSREDITITKTPLLRNKRSSATEDDHETASPSTKAGGNKEAAVVVVEKKKKRRMLKHTTNVANNFLNCNGDAEGDLDPKLNLPLQLSPLKGGDPSSSSNPTLGIRSAAAANRLFGR